MGNRAIGNRAIGNRAIGNRAIENRVRRGMTVVENLASRHLQFELSYSCPIVAHSKCICNARL